MRRSCLFLSCLLVCVLCEPVNAVSFTVGFPPGAAFANLAALNTNYGLPDPSALTVEDFDDGTLVPGLTITSNGGSSFVFPSVGSSAWHLDPSTFATWIMINTTVAGEAINSVEFSGGSTESIDFDALQFQPVPEPSSLSLLVLGLGGLTVVRRRRREA